MAWSLAFLQPQIRKGKVFRTHLWMILLHLAMTLGWMLVTRCAFFAPGAAPAGLGVPPEQHLRADPRGAEVAHRALGRFTAPGAEGERRRGAGAGWTGRCWRVRGFGRNWRKGDERFGPNSMSPPKERPSRCDRTLVSAPPKCTRFPTRNCRFCRRSAAVLRSEEVDFNVALALPAVAARAAARFLCGTDGFDPLARLGGGGRLWRCGG